MDPTERARINQRYDTRLDQYGDDIRTLASGTEERRNLRFQILTEVGIDHGCSVLDVGCGFGDYCGYLARRGLEIDYTGIDINPRLIEWARRKYPAGRFEVRDVQTDPPDEADFIVSSSSFNLRLTSQDNYAFVEDLLARLFPRARRGMAIDFLSSYVDYSAPEAFHYEPERLFAMAKQLTRRVCLRHDYPLFEFCLYLYPTFTGWAPRS